MPKEGLDQTKAHYTTTIVKLTTFLTPHFLIYALVLVAWEYFFS